MMVDFQKYIFHCLHPSWKIMMVDEGIYALGKYELDKNIHSVEWVVFME